MHRLPDALQHRAQCLRLAEHSQPAPRQVHASSMAWSGAPESDAAHASHPAAADAAAEGAAAAAAQDAAPVAAHAAQLLLAAKPTRKGVPGSISSGPVSMLPQHLPRRAVRLQRHAHPAPECPDHSLGGTKK